MGRATRGVIGIRMEKKDQLISMEVVGAGTMTLAATENGYGKRTSVEEYTLPSPRRLGHAGHAAHGQDRRHRGPLAG